jgi:hypothetical protein
MASGGTLGAATPVVGGSGGSQPANEKSVSYVRKEFGATAERRGRPREFAEAMVDVDVEIAGVVTKGKLLTLTATEALKHKSPSGRQTRWRARSRPPACPTRRCGAVFRGREGFGSILAGRQCAVVLAHQGGRRVVAYGPQCRDDGLVPEVIRSCGRE